MGIDLTFKADGHVFNARAAAIIKHEGYLLCAQEAALDFLYLPGGRIKRGETSSQTFRREMREELDIEIVAQHPQIISESFYDGVDGRYHEFSFYYFINKPNSLQFAPNEVCHVHREGDKEVGHKWVQCTAEGLAEAQVEPRQLHHHLIDLPKSAVHVTINE